LYVIVVFIIVVYDNNLFVTIGPKCLGDVQLVCKEVTFCRFSGCTHHPY